MAKKKSNRDKLVEFTYKELKKFGYFEASTTTILKKAKLPKGVMYHYFDSKEQLVVTAIDEILSKKIDKLFEMDNSFESLIEFLTTIFEREYKDIVLLQRLLIETKETNKEIYNRSKKLYDAINNNIELVLTDSKINTEISSLILSTIFGALALGEKKAIDSLVSYLQSFHKKPKKPSNTAKKKVVQKSLF